MLTADIKVILNKPILFALSKIPGNVEALVVAHQKDLEEAWASAEDTMTISFGVKIGIVNGKNIGEVSISFIKEKIKDVFQFSWDEKQPSLKLAKDLVEEKPK